MNAPINPTSFHSIVGRALSDVEFCERLIAEPEQTLQENGVEPTPEMVHALQRVDAATIRKLASAFGKSQAA
jgi:hypothetical protein